MVLEHLPNNSFFEGFKTKKGSKQHGLPLETFVHLLLVDNELRPDKRIDEELIDVICSEFSHIKATWNPKAIYTGNNPQHRPKRLLAGDRKKLNEKSNPEIEREFGRMVFLRYLGSQRVPCIKKKEATIEEIQAYCEIWEIPDPRFFDMGKEVAKLHKLPVLPEYLIRNAPTSLPRFKEPKNNIRRRIPERA